MRRITALVGVVVAVGAAGCGGQPPSANPAAPSGTLNGAKVASAKPAEPRRLSRGGRILWQFEALLRDTFGNQSVSAHYRRGAAINFACASKVGCSPLAYWSPYFFTFVRPRHSAFHVSKKRFPPGYFGNYPIAVLVKGRFVACDRAEKKFLISYGDAVGLSLDCK